MLIEELNIFNAGQSKANKQESQQNNTLIILYYNKLTNKL